MKKFWSNLKNVISVQKGALVLGLAFAILIITPSVLVLTAIGLSVTSNAIVAGVIGIGVIELISLLVIARHFYKELVRKSAEIVVKKNRRAGYKARKEADKASRKAQNKLAVANEIENKYHE